MNTEKFEEIWTSQVASEKSVLLERAEVYATNGDRLDNFYSGAIMNKTTPMRYGFGLVTKHIIALRDIIIKLSDGKGEYTEREAGKFNEYVTDIRNYSVLLKALYLEERAKKRGDVKRTGIGLSEDSKRSGKLVTASCECEWCEEDNG